MNAHRLYCRLPLAVVLMTSILAGCTWNYEVKGTLENPPTVQGLPIPVAVGVYYGPELRAYKHTHSKPFHSYVVPVGEPSERLLNQVFRKMFQTVVPVSGRPPLKTPSQGLVAVIEPRIEEFHSDFPALLIYVRTYVEVVYRFTLYSLDGTPVASWIVQGEGEDTSFGGMGEFLGDASALALKDAAVKLLTGFRDVPEVKRWLKETDALKPR